MKPVAVLPDSKRAVIENCVLLVKSKDSTIIKFPKSVAGEPIVEKFADSDSEPTQVSLNTADEIESDVPKSEIINGAECAVDITTAARNMNGLNFVFIIGSIF